MLSDFSTIRQLFHITEDNGFTENEILAYKKVCKTMPQALFEYYRQLGKCEFNQVQDNLLVPAELRLSQNQQFLIFYQENQLACVWAIAVADLINYNPPVYISYDEKFATEKWQIETDTLSDFFDTMAHLQAVFGLPFQSEDFYSISEQELGFIEENFARKSFKLTYWINAVFYGNDTDEVIYIEKNANEILMAYASFDKQKFNEIEKLLGNLGE